MRFDTLPEWLAWQERLHPNKIDLGLDRIRRVLQRLGLEFPPYHIVTIAGTNGKGSSVMMLEAVLSAAGYRIGAYTSPHLLRYNERIRICQQEVEDTRLCRAFERVDQARGDISLTYFEFGTLAAFEIFHYAGLDLAVLEVGMGGRLDAVNVLDSDVALVTSVGIDHVNWLGPDRETIGWEKAGIFRASRPAVCGDPVPPQSLLRHAQQLKSPLYRRGHDFGYLTKEETWSWWGPEQNYNDLPCPALYGPFQIQNAANVIMVLELLKPRFHITQKQLAFGLEHVTISGRFQLIPGAIPCILDVAHNPHGAAALARALRQQPCPGRTHVVMGMLSDKDIPGVIREMMEVVDTWHMASLATERGASSDQLAEGLESLGREDIPARRYGGVMSAYQGAFSGAQSGDRIVIFGSFHTVADFLRHHTEAKN